MIKLNGKEVIFKTFPNGETLMVHDELNLVRVNTGRIENEVIFKYENDSDLIKLMILKQYLDTFDIEANLLITYMPYSRMDRSENNSPFTLKYISKFINSLNFYEVIIIEPHSDVTCALVENAWAEYINFDLVEKVKKDVGFDNDGDYIVFPDAGASKRYSKMKAKNVLVGHKHRDFETGKIQSLELVGSVVHKPNKAIIVDDLSSYGGTFVHTAKALYELGFNEVYLLVCHSENSIFKGELFNYITKVFTTDSILTEQNNWENAKYREQLHIFELEGVLLND